MAFTYLTREQIETHSNEELLEYLESAVLDCDAPQSVLDHARTADRAGIIDCVNRWHLYVLRKAHEKPAHAPAPKPLRQVKPQSNASYMRTYRLRRAWAETFPDQAFPDWMPVDMVKELIKSH